MQKLLELWQVGCRHCFPGEPVPVTKHALSEEPFPQVQSELSLAQLHSLSSCPIAGHQGEEISISSSRVPGEEVVGCDEVIPQPSLLQAEHAYVVNLVERKKLKWAKGSGNYEKYEGSLSLSSM